MADTRTRRSQPVDLPGIHPVLLPRVSDEVAEQIRRLIVSEQLAEGARLPAERELADRFEVSRPMVSQALRMLSLMGLIEIRRGSGAPIPATLPIARCGRCTRCTPTSQRKSGSRKGAPPPASAAWNASSR